MSTKPTLTSACLYVSAHRSDRSICSAQSWRSSMSRLRGQSSGIVPSSQSMPGSISCASNHPPGSRLSNAFLAQSRSKLLQTPVARRTNM